MTDSVPTDAMSVFLYSPQQAKLRDNKRLPRFCYVCPDGSKSAYTKEIAAGLPDTDAKIAEYQKEFPDARIVGYGTADTQKLALPLPTMAFAAPR
jgi:hypothetical protein